MSITVSVIIYLLTIIISSYAFYLAGKSRQKITFIISMVFAIGIPVFIAGVRYLVGTDYGTYIRAFELIRFGQSVRWTGLEYGFVLLNVFLVRLGLSPQSIMFATSIIMMCFVSKALLKKREVISVGIGALTFMLLFYQSSFNIIRMMIAVSIFLYNVSNIENRKLLKYLFFTVLAATFHISALVTIPLYWIFGFLGFEKSLFKRLLIYISAGLIVLYFNLILTWILSVLNFTALSYYANYIGDSGETIDLGIKQVIIYLPILIPGAFMYQKCKEQDKNFGIYYSLVVIGVIVKGITTFNLTYVDRLAEYFIIAAVIVIPVYIQVFKKNRKFLFIVGMICYLFLYWIYIYIIFKHHGTVPYQWIL